MPDSLRPHGLQPTRLLCPWDFPGKDTGVGCHFLLQGIFPTQGSKLGLLYCRQILYQLSYKGSPMQETKEAMWETPVQFLGREDPLEKGMATHSSILAWRIPWTEESGGLQSMGSQSRTWLNDLAQHNLTILFVEKLVSSWSHRFLCNCEKFEVKLW